MRQRLVGVEEEFLLVDPATGQAVAGFDTLHDALGADVELVDKELKREQAEIASAPFRDLAELRADLRRRRDALKAAAGSRSMALAAAATSPVAGPARATRGERYAKMADRYQLVEGLQLTCGMHVHVAISSRAEGVTVLDRIRPWLAVLTALSANSPYWQGLDTGYASYRSILWGQWPTAGPTGTFDDPAGYDAVVNDLLASGAILDEGMIYFDARLSRHYPTVEIRVADVCTDVDTAAALAAICRGLVDAAAEESERSRDAEPARTELLRVAGWTAARFGLTGDLVDVADRRSAPASAVVDRLLGQLRARLRRNGDADRVDAAIALLLAEGTGSQRQRSQLAASGSLAGVVGDIVART